MTIRNCWGLLEVVCVASLQTTKNNHQYQYQLIVRISNVTVIVVHANNEKTHTRVCARKDWNEIFLKAVAR